MASDAKFFSRWFIKECGAGSIKLGQDYSKLNVYFMISSVSNDQLKHLINTEDAVINDAWFRKVNFRLLNVSEANYNKDTFEESSHTYQEMRNESVIEYAFSNENDSKYDNSKDSIIRQSIDYNDASMFYVSNYDPEVANDRQNKSKYLSLLSEYGVSHDDIDVKRGYYRSAEFFRLNIKEDRVIENEIVLKCDDLQYFEASGQADDDKIESPLSRGVYGFLLTYTAANKEIPMLAYRFAKPTYSNYNRIKFVFNVNGLFGVV